MTHTHTPTFPNLPESKLQRLNSLEWGRAGASQATEEIDRVPGIRR